MHYFYIAYGLPISSEIPLPELPTTEPGRPAINIRFGAIKNLEQADQISHWCSMLDETFFITVSGVANYQIVGGQDILIDPIAQSGGVEGSVQELDTIRLYLLGSVLAICLMQRSLMPLHVSALTNHGNAIAFTGGSGAGKSTTAAFLRSRLGWRPLTDDVGRLEFSDDRCFLYPGTARVRLKKDALDYLDQGERFERIEHGNGSFKYQACVPLNSIESSKLCALVLLNYCNSGEEPALIKLSGVDAFQVCRATMYRPYLAQLLLPPTLKIEMLSRMARAIPIFTWQRKFSLDYMEENVTALLSGLTEHGILPLDAGRRST